MHVYGEVNGTITGSGDVSGHLNSSETLRGSLQGSSVVYENDYEVLRNKPRIEGVELLGDKTFEELNLQGLTNSELEEMLTL